MQNAAAVLTIEAKTMVEMLRHDILPAVSRYGGTLCHTASEKSALGLPCDFETRTAREVSALTDDLFAACETLEGHIAAIPATAQEAMDFCYQTIVPAMHHARDLADHLETLTAEEYWPFPGYGELLFSPNHPPAGGILPGVFDPLSHFFTKPSHPSLLPFRRAACYTDTEPVLTF